MPEGTLQRTGPRCSPPATGCAQHCAPRALLAPYIDPAAAPPLARPHSQSLTDSAVTLALSQVPGEGWSCAESQSEERTVKEAGRRAEWAGQEGSHAPPEWPLPAGIPAVIGRAGARVKGTPRGSPGIPIDPQRSQMTPRDVRPTA